MITQAILDADQAAIAAAQTALANAQAAVTVAQAAVAAAQDTLAADVAQAQREAHPILAVLDDIQNAVLGQAAALGVDFEAAFAALVAKARSYFPAVALPAAPAAPAPTPTVTDPVPAPATTDTGATTGDTAVPAAAPEVLADPAPAAA